MDMEFRDRVRQSFDPKDSQWRIRANNLWNIGLSFSSSLEIENTDNYVM